MKNQINIIIITSLFAWMSQAALAADGGLLDAGVSEDTPAADGGMEEAAPDAGVEEASSDAGVEETSSDAGEEEPAPEIGEEGGPCYGNGTCNEGLICEADVCVLGPAAEDAGVAQPSTDAGTAVPPTTIDATVTIVSPSDGDTVDGPLVEIRFQIDGCNISGPNQDAFGCHVHKMLDGLEYNDPSGGGLGHYNPNPFSVVINAAGSHEFSLLLIRNDGSDAPFEPQIFDTVTFTVDIEEPTNQEEEEEEEEPENKRIPPPEANDTGGCGCDVSNQSAKNPWTWLALCAGLLVLRRRRK